jgi:hypothetical protein
LLPVLFGAALISTGTAAASTDLPHPHELK